MIETAMVLFMETTQRQRHSKLWAQGHPKGPGCLDASKAMGTEKSQRFWVLGHPNSPGCRDVPPGTLGAEMPQRPWI